MPTGVESWSVINDQDAVARSGKLLGMFKRAGERIFLNHKGDMLVCPGFLEAALWRKLRSTNVRHHMLAAYLKVRVPELFAHCAGIVAMLPSIRLQLAVACRQRHHVHSALFLRDSPPLRCSPLPLSSSGT